MAKSSDVIVIRTFPSTADAEIAKSILDEAGIESMIRLLPRAPLCVMRWHEGATGTVEAGWYHPDRRADEEIEIYPALSGAELLVRTEDVDKASVALDRRNRRSNVAHYAVPAGLLSGSTGPACPFGGPCEGGRLALS
jgi:hypothetical protein